MNFSQIIAQLDSLPQTFTSPGETYAQFVASFAAGLAGFTDATDEISAESTSLSSARYGWLDVWGLLFGIVRNLNEADYNYRARISAYLTAWVGTLPAIASWGDLIFNEDITVSENAGGLGFVIIVPGGVSSAALVQFANSLARVRPAGVPFRIGVQSSGLYLDTINYLDCAKVTGAYLTDSISYISLSVSASTNNAVPILPSLYLNDPTLNPSLAST